MDMEEIGAQIRAARKDRHLTLGALGDELGMSPATLSMLETGAIQELGIRKVMRVMERLGIEFQVTQAQSGYTLDDANRDIGLGYR